MAKTLLGSNRRFLAALLFCGLAPAQSSLSVATKIVDSANGFLEALQIAERARSYVDDVVVVVTDFGGVDFSCAQLKLHKRKAAQAAVRSLMQEL